jgi:hypothetical protein
VVAVQVAIAHLLEHQVADLLLNQESLSQLTLTTQLQLVLVDQVLQPLPSRAAMVLIQYLQVLLPQVAVVVVQMATPTVLMVVLVVVVVVVFHHLHQAELELLIRGKMVEQVAATVLVVVVVLQALVVMETELLEMVGLV